MIIRLTMTELNQLAERLAQSNAKDAAKYTLYQPFNFKLLALQQADEHWQWLHNDCVVAHASLWWQANDLRSLQQAILGHVNASEAKYGLQLLMAIKEYLAALKIKTIIGPMDGSTWFNYRITQASKPAIAPFLLEPIHQPIINDSFFAAGFSTCQSYSSYQCALDAFKEPNYGKIKQRLAQFDAHIEPLTADGFLHLLPQLHEFCQSSFKNNAYYRPIGLAEFVALYTPLSGLISPKYCFILRQRSRLTGFMFAYPSGNQLILKTCAIEFSRASSGASRVMIADIVNAARQQGLTHVVYALMADDNESQKTAAKFGQPLRHYQLLCCSLQRDPND